MNNRNNTKPVRTCILLALATAGASSVVAEPSSQYSYTDEWSIVSAPPPSGPFRSIHLDPRIPGQGVAPPALAPNPEQLVEQAVDTGPAATGSTTSDLSQLPAPAAGYGTPPPAMPAPPRAGAAMTGTDMPPHGMLPPPPGPGEMPSPPMAGTEPAPMEPRGMMPPMPGPEDMPMDPRGMMPPMPKPGDMPAPPRTEPAPMEPRGMMPPMPKPEDMPMDPRGMMPPMPGPGDMPMDPRKMMPPMHGEQQVKPGEMAEQPGSRPEIKPATRPPLTESYGRMAPPAMSEGERGYSMPPAAEQQPPVSGQYGRMRPQYHAPWQYGPGMPAYGNWPQYGHQRAPAPRQDQDIPPPSAYPEDPYYGGSTTPQQ